MRGFFVTLIVLLSRKGQADVRWYLRHKLNLWEIMHPTKIGNIVSWILDEHGRKIRIFGLDITAKKA